MSKAAKTIVLITGKLPPLPFPSPVLPNTIHRRPTGVGYAAAHILTHASPSYHVILACRLASKASTALTSFQATSPLGTLSTLSLKVPSEPSILANATEFASTHGWLDVLISNAAVGATSPNIRERFEAALKINVIGPRLVAEHFRPLLLKAEQPRSVYLSGGAGNLESAPEIRKVLQPANRDAFMLSKTAVKMVAMLG